MRSPDGPPPTICTCGEAILALPNRSSASGYQWVHGGEFSPRNSAEPGKKYDHVATPKPETS